MFTKRSVIIAIAAGAACLLIGGDATARGSFRGAGLAGYRASGNIARWHGPYRNGSQWRHHLDRRHDHDGRRHADRDHRYGEHRRFDRDHDGHHRGQARDGHWHRSTGFGHHAHAPGAPGEWHKASGFGGKDGKYSGAMGEWHKTPSGFAPEWRAK